MRSTLHSPSNFPRNSRSSLGGYIQAVYLFDSPCAIVCGEESKLNGEPLNRALRDDEGHIYDVIAGTFLIVGLGEEDFTSLGQKEMQEMSARFAVPELFMKVDGRLAVIRIDTEKTSVLGKLSEANPTPHKPSTSKSKGQER